MESNKYQAQVKRLLTKAFQSAGYKITKDLELDSVPESVKYDGLTLSIDGKKIVYRKGKITADRPGAFLAIWKRPALNSMNGNKPIALTADDLDYLFVQIQSHDESEIEASPQKILRGMFIFPVSILIEKGIITSDHKKGKTGFRVFAPWSQDRGLEGTKVFSASGKKTQSWQAPYFVEITESGEIDSTQLNKIFSKEYKKSSL